MDCEWFAGKLIEKLTKCPCCSAWVHETNKREDGIPDDMVHETVFACGARVMVTVEADYRVGAACPYPLDDELQQIRSDLEDEVDL